MAKEQVGRRRKQSGPATDQSDLGPRVNGAGNRVRARDRDATEADLLRATLRLLERNGLLGGLSLQEVADEAGVNRSLIYQYFGSRRALLRAALGTTAWRRAEIFGAGRALPFAQRRKEVFRVAVDSSAVFKVEALLALDGDEELRLFPMLDKTIEDLERDKRSGELKPEADSLVMHALTAATYLGYGVFRENMARELAIPIAELDQRAIAVFAEMLAGLSCPNRDCPTSRAGLDRQRATIAGPDPTAGAAPAP